MNKQIRWLMQMWMGLLLLGCVTTQSTEVDRPLIAEVVVRNSSSHDIEDVQISVEKVRGIFSCGVILTHSFCANSFRQRPYQGNRITVQWRANQQIYAHGPLSLGQPPAEPGMRYTIILDLKDAGALDSAFVAK